MLLHYLGSWEKVFSSFSFLAFRMLVFSVSMWMALKIAVFGAEKRWTWVTADARSDQPWQPWRQSIAWWSLPPPCWWLPFEHSSVIRYRQHADPCWPSLVDASSDCMRWTQLPLFLRICFDNGFRPKALLTQRLHSHLVTSCRPLKSFPY